MVVVLRVSSAAFQGQLSAGPMQGQQQFGREGGVPGGGKRRRGKRGGEWVWENEGASKGQQEGHETKSKQACYGVLGASSLGEGRGVLGGEERLQSLFA